MNWIKRLKPNKKSSRQVYVNSVPVDSYPAIEVKVGDVITIENGKGRYIIGGKVIPGTTISFNDETFQLAPKDE